MADERPKTTEVLFPEYESRIYAVADARQRTQPGHRSEDQSTDMSDEWQLIATAPRDGTPVLAVSMTYGRVVRIARFNGIYGWQVLPGQWRLVPTHWMPLPEIPDILWRRRCDCPAKPGERCPLAPVECETRAAGYRE